ncbi:MAG TPA: site-specific integrase [Pirellulaceae bacterium]|jgi:integrase
MYSLGKPRSPHTVRGYITCILSIINWAYLQGWLPAPVRIRKIKVGKMKVMKGRPITEVEFKRMLQKVPDVVGEKASQSWKYLLWGLWQSALRLNELMHVSWDIPGTIRPIWKKDSLPVLEIPSTMQKNDTEEEIPLLSWFEKVLLETPAEQRTGWVFNPDSLLLKLGRNVQPRRPKSDWVGKIIGKIGEKAGIIVEHADERTGRPIKYATAHDLRRSCGERMRNAGVPPLLICRILRHASWETTRKHYAPGDVQQDAAMLKKLLSPAPETASQRQASKSEGGTDHTTHNQDR